MKYKKVLEFDFLPNVIAKNFEFQIPSNLKNANLQIIAIQQTAPTNEKIFFVSCTQNETETMLSKTPLKNQNLGIADIYDFLKDYFEATGTDTSKFKNFFEKIQMPLQTDLTKIKGTIYTTEPTGHSTIQIILAYES